MGDYVKNASAISSSPLYGKVDLDNIVIAGHSMGATDSIMAGNTRTSLLTDPSLKLVIAQHPGICGPFGPPPVPYTWTKKDLLNVATHKPLMFTTATNDNAFWPAPATAKHELGCFNEALGGHEDDVMLAAFLQFSTKACAQDGAHAPFDDGGHDCSFKTGVETPWMLTAMKWHAQQNAAPTSNCARMLFGNHSRPDNSSMSLDNHVEKVFVLTNKS